MICFIATNYNNSKLTLNYIESIFKISNLINPSIIIVDNCSSKEELKLLTDSPYYNDSRCNFLHMSKNIGYFPGLNEGLKSIIHKNFECCVVGNNDLLFPEDFFDKFQLVKKELQDFPVIAPDVVTLDGFHQNPHVIKGITSLREKVYDLYYSHYWFAMIIKMISKLSGNIFKRGDEKSYKETLEIDQGFGACYVLMPKFFEYSYELWSPSFLYHEESFLSLQLSRFGFKTYYNPTLQVHHICGATTGKLMSKEKWKIAAKSHWEFRSLQSKRK